MGWPRLAAFNMRMNVLLAVRGVVQISNFCSGETEAVSWMCVSDGICSNIAAVSRHRLVFGIVHAQSQRLSQGRIRTLLWQVGFVNVGGPTLACASIPALGRFAEQTIFAG